MSNPPPLFRDQRKVDAEHLKLLTIFHFIIAGLAVVGLAFLMIHYMVMSSVFSNPEMWKGNGHHAAPPPKEFFMFFKWLYAFVGVFLLLGAIGNLLSAFYLRARKNRMFSLVIAGLNCLQVPLGTVLGVFTIVVLTRDSVRETYESQGLMA
ncbi:hypothetical protein ACXR0O_20815 [Verrucomicrobiota bacterium sgz303538]